MYRPKTGTLKVKWLKEFKAVTRFIEKNIGKYYKITAKQYFIKDYPINIT